MQEMGQRTLQVEENIGLVVFEHLGDKFDVHVLDVNLLDGIRSSLLPKRTAYLDALVHHHDSLVEFLLKGD